MSADLFGNSIPNFDFSSNYQSPDSSDPVSPLNVHNNGNYFFDPLDDSSFPRNFPTIPTIDSDCFKKPLDSEETSYFTSASTRLSSQSDGRNVTSNQSQSTGSGISLDSTHYDSQSRPKINPFVLPGFGQGLASFQVYSQQLLEDRFSNLSRQISSLDAQTINGLSTLTPITTASSTSSSPPEQAKTTKKQNPLRNIPGSIMKRLKFLYGQCELKEFFRDNKIKGKTCKAVQELFEKKDVKHREEALRLVHELLDNVDGRLVAWFSSSTMKEETKKAILNKLEQLKAHFEDISKLCFKESKENSAESGQKTKKIDQASYQELSNASKKNVQGQRKNDLVQRNIPKKDGRAPLNESANQETHCVMVKSSKKVCH